MNKAEQRESYLSEIVDDEYRDEWNDHILFRCGDTHVELVLTFRQWEKLFVATDLFISPFRGQGRTKEEATLDYLRKKLSLFDIEDESSNTSG